MYEFQRRLINEAAKFGPLSPKEKANLPKECLNEEIVNLGEGISTMKGVEKAVVAAHFDFGTYKRLLAVLKNKTPGHALVLDKTTPTVAGTNPSSDMKVVKTADIGKNEFMGYKFPSMKPGAKATRTWKDHKGEATILAISESVQEETENLDEAVHPKGLDYLKLPTNVKAYSMFKHDTAANNAFNAAHNTYFTKSHPKADEELHRAVQYGVGMSRAPLIADKYGILKPQHQGLLKDKAKLLNMKEDAEAIEEASIESVAMRHQLKIARSTVKMNPAMAGVMGGMSIHQAHTFLLQNGTPAEKKAARDYLQTHKESVETEEGVEDLQEFDSEFKQTATHNLAVSTKLAKKKNKDHDSQWGVGFRAYCRAVISGNAINMDPPKEQGLRSGWNDARQMTAMARRIKEEVESLDEMTGKEARNILSGVRKVKVVKPTAISSQMKVGSTYQLIPAGAHINPSLPGGDKKYRLVTGSLDMGTRTQTGAIISTNLAKAIKRGEIEIVKEEVENLGEATTGFPDLDKWFSKLPQSFVAEVKTLSKILHAPGTPGKTPVKNEDRITIEKLMTKHKVKTYVSINMTGKPYSDQWSYSARMVVRYFKKYFDMKESVEDLGEAMVKAELEKFLFALPQQATDEIRKASEKMGGLKSNTTTKTLIKTILTKHRVKLMKDMDTSVTAVIEWFDEMMEEQVSEAYAPQWAYARQKQHPILGQFKYKNNVFEYRAIVKGTPGSDWALSHGMTHEVFMRPVFGDHRDSRFGIVKATVVQIATDESEGGKPVYEKWPITGHSKYEDHPSNPTGFKKYG